MIFFFLFFLQVSALAGGNHSDLPAVPQTRRGAAIAQAGAGGLLDGLPGGGHQEGRVLGPIPCKLQTRESNLRKKKKSLAC